MPEKNDDQNLVEKYLSALQRNDIQTCEQLLLLLQQEALTTKSASQWCDYCRALLLNERDNDWAEAERILRRVWLGEPPIDLSGRVLIALGVTQEYLGRWPEAIQTYKQALALFQSLQQPIDQAKILKNMAIVYERGFTSGDFDADVLPEALACCRHALSILSKCETETMEFRWLEGSVWNTEGLIYRDRREWTQALQCFQKDLEFCQASDDLDGIARSLNNQGEIHHRLGDSIQAEACFQRALQSFIELDESYEAADVLSNLGLLHQDHNDLPAAIDCYCRSVDLREKIRAGISSDEARAAFFATTLDAFDHLCLLYLAAGETGKAFETVERARARAFLDLLDSGGATLARNVESVPLGLAEIQSHLPPQALLLEYYTTGLLETRPGRAVDDDAFLRHRFPAAKVLVFAVTRDQIRFHEVQISPNALRPQRLEHVVERHFLQPLIRRKLYQELLAPFDLLLRQSQVCYLIPHGPLHYIPFQALLSAGGDTFLRSSGPCLAYAPSASILFRSMPVQPPRLTVPCLAIGYNSQGATRLRFAEGEAAHVARLSGGQALLGEIPKKEAFFQQAANYRWLHFACHADFAPLSPLDSSLNIGPDEKITTLDILQNLHLSGSLVVLSACESGLSRVRRGDELVGFTRAFLSAGASNLVLTLWRVDDLSTRLLVEKLYQGILNGEDIAHALKSAQVYLQNLPAQEARAWLKDSPEWQDRLAKMDPEHKIFADPYYWAAFIVVGFPGISAPG